MIFTTPLMLLGLLALPVLAAVYLLRSKSRRVEVSSLAFWLDRRSPRHGGRIVQRMQTPLCFFLELAAIALLVLAAAGPAVRVPDAVRPLVVVLDDSYSMLARPLAASGDPAGGPTVREQAAEALAAELRRGNYATRFVLAGVRPRLAGEPVAEPAQAARVLERWTCQSPLADLSAAVALAAEVGGPAARILVLTDRPPPENGPVLRPTDGSTQGAEAEGTSPSASLPAYGGQVQWWALGSPLPNMAFTAAHRTRSADGERVLLEVANLSDAPAATTLTLEGAHLAAADTRTVRLDAGAATQLFLNLPAGTPPLEATLADDALQIDNRVLLLPDGTEPLRVRVDMAGDALREAVSRALAATARTMEVTVQPELVVTDRPRAMIGDAWQLDILPAADAVAYAGPFVVDQNHALARGLSLHRAVWSAGSDTAAEGFPVITAGNVPLLTESEAPAGGRRLRMAFDARLSNVQDTPDWPILFANLVEWRRAGLPGIRAPNVRLGQTVPVVLPDEAEGVQLTLPSGLRRGIETQGRRIDLPAEEVGLHTIRAGEVEYRFASNALSREASDLTACRSGRWGNWDDSPAHQERRAGLAWLFLLLALAMLAGHLVVVAKSFPRGGA